ncbi:MAG: hypothetical protein AB1414_13180 [bacterium]
MKNNQLINKKVLDEIKNICLDEEYEIRIEVGGIILSIKTNDYELNELMKRKFYAFLSSDSPQLVVEIQVKEKIQTGSEGSKCVVDEWRVLFSKGYSYAGIADFKQKKGQVIIIPSEKNNTESIIRRFLSYFLIEFNGFFLHAASVVVDSNRGFIFCGKCGCGKTTIANLSDKYTVLNDDMSLIRKINNQYKVYSTPFYGNRINSYVWARIESLLFPKKDKEVYIKKYSIYSSLKEIIPNIFLLFGVLHHFQREKVFNLCSEIIEKVPCYELHFLKDGTFWTHILSVQGERRK